MLVNQGAQHIQHDVFPVRVQIAAAWSAAFETAKLGNCQS